MVSRLMFLIIIGDAPDFFRLASKQKKSGVFHSAFIPKLALIKCINTYTLRISI